MGEGQTIECGDNKILKLYDQGVSKEEAEEEVRITRLVRDLGIPAPYVHGVVEREGRWGIIFDNIIGPTYLRWTMDHRKSIEKMSKYFAYVHHEMQLHQSQELPSLKVHMREAIEKAKDLPESSRGKVLEQLKRLPDGEWVCHGDFHPLNVVVALDGPIIIDWARATHGYHLADVMNTSLILELGVLYRKLPEEEREEAQRVLEPFHRIYLHESVKIYGKSDEEVLAWRAPLAAARLPSAVEDEKEQLIQIVESALK